MEAVQNVNFLDNIIFEYVDILTWDVLIEFRHFNILDQDSTKFDK